MTACAASCTRSSLDGDVCGIFLERKCCDWLVGRNKMDLPFNDVLNVGHISCHFDKPDLIMAVSVSSHLLEMSTFMNASEKQVGGIDVGRHLGRSDMVVARCWQQWITEGRVYRRGGSGRPRNTNDREDRAIRRVATSAPTTSLASIQRHLPPSQTSSAIKRNHKETTDRSWLEEPTSAKTLTTDPTS
ncbi:hypothetical protein TNCV_1319701 [Trichonephila clavipes]|nr:hypothetical protein TNCV_1319701 [Trichonephila clavipes]